MQIPGTDDVSDLERTRNAFTILGSFISIYVYIFEFTNTSTIRFFFLTN